MSNSRNYRATICLAPNAHCRSSTKLRRRPGSMRRGSDGAGNGLRDSARWLRRHPWKHPRRNGQRRRLRYANPIHAASKSDTPRLSGDRSGAREGQSTAGADTKERLNTCNRRLFTRVLPTVRHPASTVGGARALSTPGNSRPPSSTKRYAVAADGRGNGGYAPSEPARPKSANRQHASGERSTAVGAPHPSCTRVSGRRPHRSVRACTRSRRRPLSK
jgi:hypothetical protein